MEELLCGQCGALNHEKQGESVRCSECGALLQYGTDAPSERSAALKAPKPRNKSAPPQDDSPAPTTFTADADDRQEPPPHAEFAPREKKKLGAGKRKRRKKRRAPKASADKPEWWAEWVDPAGLLWLGIAIPVLTVATLTIPIGLSMMSIINFSRRPMTGLGVPFFLGGAFLGGVTLAFLSRRFSSILRAWAEGERVDPRWDELDVVEVLRFGSYWLCAAISTALVTAAAVWLLRALPIVEPMVGHPLGRLAVGLVTAGYFSVTVLAVVMFEDPLAASPVVAFRAIFRLRVGRGRFAAELAAVFLLLTLLYQAVASAGFWGLAHSKGSVPLVILSCAAWWTAFVLSVSRLMRSLGMLYVRNARSLGWFA